MFDFFISHSSRYKEIAKVFYYTAHLNGLNPWLDEAKLEIGQNLDDELKNGIKNSKAYLLIHSKYVYESDYIKREIEFAKNIKANNNDFKFLIIKIDQVEIKDESIKRYFYADWNDQKQYPSILRVIEVLTNKKNLVNLNSIALLNKYPTLLSQEMLGTIAEQQRNYLILQIANYKEFLSSLLKTYRTEEDLVDSIQQLMETTTFSSIPSLMSQAYQIGNGTWELLHGNRMRTVPRVIMSGYPEEYKFILLENNHVFTKFKFEKDNMPVLGAIPFIVELDAEL